VDRRLVMETDADVVISLESDGSWLSRARKPPSSRVAREDCSSDACVDTEIRADAILISRMVGTGTMFRSEKSSVSWSRAESINCSGRKY
jgi:hypothetical protein